MASVACVAGAREANVFASGLKATQAEGTKYNITYTLNAAAQSVIINVYNGENLLKSFTSEGLAKGENTTTIDLDGLNGELTWSIKASGEAWAEGETATMVIDKSTNPLLSFMSPRGITIDQDPESEFYGRVYVTETRAAEMSDRTTNVGIYVFDAAFNDITGQGNVAYGGNVQWGASSGCTRIFLNKDGKIYLSDWSDAHPGVWRADANDLTADFVPVFGGTPNSDGLRFNDDGVAISGSIPSCWVEGTGENTVLYTFDEDYINDNGNAMGLYQYNIGNLEQPWTTAPSAIIYNNVDKLHQNGNSVIIPQNGGWWISQTRWTDGGGIPSLVYVKDNVVLFNSGEVDATMIGSSYQAAICLFDDGTKMAVSSMHDIKVFNVAFDDSGVPSLTLDCDITHSLGQNCYSIVIDNAHNMYCSVDRTNSSSTGNVGVFALPVAENSCETPAPSSQIITIGGGGGIVGDVNADGSVNASDVTALYNFILNGNTTFIDNSDVNNDGSVNASDVTAVYNIILGN